VSLRASHWHATWATGSRELRVIVLTDAIADTLRLLPRDERALLFERLSEEAAAVAYDETVSAANGAALELEDAAAAVILRLFGEVGAAEVFAGIAVVFAGGGE
jgi:hypothetical protein